MMEGQGQAHRERTSNRRRQRRKAKASRNKVVVEPELIAARRPDSPLLKNGFVIASASPKAASATKAAPTVAALAKPDAEAARGPELRETEAGSDAPRVGDGPEHENGSEAHDKGRDGRRRAVRIVKVTESALGPGNREQQLLDRLVRSQGRGAISRAADDLWESKFVPPKRQEIQIQLLEHENEQRARDAVFAMAELLQREPPIQRPVLDQRLRRLETMAEDPITRDAAGALRRSMRVHYGA